jgi:Fe-S-cluster containining protein
MFENERLELLKKVILLKNSIAANPNIDDQEVLVSAYNLLDDYNETIKDSSVCSKGCGYCCYIPVGITYIEARYINDINAVNKNQKIKINNEKQEPDIALRKYEEGEYYGKCPFLNDKNECDIYNARPFVCRTFHTTDDSSFCKREFNAILENKKAILENPEKFTHSTIHENCDYILRLLHDIILISNQKYGNYFLKDIREFFPIL